MEKARCKMREKKAAVLGKQKIAEKKRKKTAKQRASSSRRKQQQTEAVVKESAALPSSMTIAENMSSGVVRDAISPYLQCE